MDTLKLGDLKRLLSPRSGHCLSLTMPTHVGGVAGEDDAPRLLRLLERAAAELEAHGLDARDAGQLLDRVRQLATNKEFWKARNRSLAVFASADFFQAFRLPLDLPEEISVGRHFCVKPLLPMLGGEDQFYILALSRHSVRLFSASKYLAEEVDVPGMPKSLEEALGVETADRGEQVHSGGNLGNQMGTSRKQAAVFHGHGGHRDTSKQDLARFFRLVDEALHETLREQQKPLVLAGVEYELPIYQEVCTYPHVVSEGVPGNFDRAGPAELRDKAWPIVEPRLHQARRKAAEHYRDLAGSHTAVRELGDVLSAGFAGRVAALFVDPNHTLRGTFDEATGRVTLSANPRADDLIELAVSQTMLKRGNVYALDDSEAIADKPLCALLRY